MTTQSPLPASHPTPKVLRQVTPFAAVMLCDNPGVMTLEGTNTWILRAPGRTESVVVDPGPNDKGHLKRVLAAAGTVALTLVSHRHKDHTGGLRRWGELSRSPIRAFSPKYCLNAATVLAGGEVIDVAGVRITVLHTPGHTADSLSFLVDVPSDVSSGASGQVPGDDRDAGALLSGDTLLGRGTTVLDPSDGTLADYLHSLDSLAAVADGRTLLPGHGPDLPDAGPVVTAYAAHRQERLQQVREALTELNVSAAKAKPLQVVRHAYRDVPKNLWPAARMSVKAQLKYLAETEPGER